MLIPYPERDGCTEDAHDRIQMCTLATFFVSIGIQLEVQLVILCAKHDSLTFHFTVIMSIVHYANYSLYQPPVKPNVRYAQRP